MIIKPAGISYGLLVSSEVLKDGGSVADFGHDFITFITLLGLRSSMGQGKAGVLYFDVENRVTAFNSSTQVFDTTEAIWI